MKILYCMVVLRAQGPRPDAACNSASWGARNNMMTKHRACNPKSSDATRRTRKSISPERGLQCAPPVYPQYCRLYPVARRKEGVPDAMWMLWRELGSQHGWINTVCTVRVLVLRTEPFPVPSGFQCSSSPCRRNSV